MKQIPNIEEEEFENYIYQLYQQYFSLEEKGLITHTTHSVTDSVNFEEIVLKHKEIIHHQLQKAYEQGSLDGYKNGLKTAVDMGQCNFPTSGITDKTELQKARQDWLREEIVRLEGEKRNYPMIEEPEWRRGYTEALDDQITRHTEELLELDKTKGF